MKPASFDYYAPTSIEEALDHLAELGYDGKVLAGGQSLIAAMNFRMATPAALIDLNQIPELFYIKPAEDGGVLVGAMTRDGTIEFDPLVKERLPLLYEVMPFVAHPQIRNRGTFGGSIAHADPTGHLPAIAEALSARFLVRSKNGERWVESEDYFVGPFATAMEPEELLVEVALPPMRPRSGASYKQLARQTGAQALVGVASVVDLDEAGRCQNARVVLISVGETPVLALQAQQILTGQSPTPDVIRAAAEIASTADIDPGGDIHCSVEYRRHLVNVLTQRSLTEAFDRAMRSGG